MRRFKLIILITFCCFLFSCSTGYKVVTSGPQTATRRAPGISKGAEISILTWNIGYAGLGEDAEFITDGGNKIISSSKKQVRQNVESIKTFLSGHPTDIFLIQEMALPSNVNRFINIYEEIKGKLPYYWHSYSPKVALAFPPVSINVGSSILSRIKPVSIERVELPLEEKPILGVYQKHHLLVARYSISNLPNELVVVNVHLSAFDDNAETRRKQLKALDAIIRNEYEAGDYVICGGDWNLVLDNTEFPYTTEEKYLFWVFDLPGWFPPKGWKKAADPASPTVRSLERPYVKDENYTTIIDGFVLSPNVKLIGVKTINRGFISSDHNPVQVRVRLARK
jgi:endonuclease/exonuclease/phosphatase family metal-dependent hydrolase